MQRDIDRGREAKPSPTSTRLNHRLDVLGLVLSGKPIVWMEAERRKRQAWGLKTIDTFHTHGTPPAAQG